jgi:peptide-methionine (S)-S-oxide reductase
VGYTGGHTEEPTYKEVCSDSTGHAEAVEVTYDPDRVSFDELLEVFWNEHDPTQVDRQGPDVGSQYRSAVFTHDEEQARLAEAYKRRLDASGAHGRPVVTRIEPASTFWPAEEYHQQYLVKRGLATCRI